MRVVHEMDGVVEPVFPEADAYPAYRTPTKVVAKGMPQATEPEERPSQVEMRWIDRYVEDALDMTGTHTVAR